MIIGVLLAIAVPSYLGFKKRAEKQASSANARSAIPATEAYYSDNEGYAGMNLVRVAVDRPGHLLEFLGVFTVSGGGAGYTLTYTHGSCTATFIGPGGGEPTNTC